MPWQFMSPSLPAVGALYEHTEGGQYVVDGLTNLESLQTDCAADRCAKFPPTVCYHRWGSLDPLHRYSTTLVRWRARFRPFELPGFRLS